VDTGKLIDEMKARVPGELLGHFEEKGVRFIWPTAIGDETWIHHYDPENKKQSMVYCHKESPSPKKFKTKASAGKVMLTVFGNPKRVLLTDFLEKSATVNLELCIENLKNLEQRITRKKAEIYDILFQQDNAKPHTSVATTDAIVCLGFTVLPHPTYSPDLAPGDFHLFPKVKEELRGKTSSLIKK